MTYEVLRDFTDPDFNVADAEGNKTPLSKAVGEKFIPAEIHYPQNRTDARVLDGTLRLIVKDKPPAEVPTGNAPPKDGVVPDPGLSTFGHPAPKSPLLSFSPTSGPEGSTVVVDGVDGDINAASVKLGEVAVSSFLVNSPNSLTFTVPLATTSGAISVTTPKGTQTGASDFTVTH